MSHVVGIDCAITELDALASAADALGLELVRGQRSYRWFGRHVGDFALPRGFKAEDLGKCEHALRVRGDDAAYEVGLVPLRSGEGWTLIYDFFGKPGAALQRSIGIGGRKLLQGYQKAVVLKVASARGLRATVDKQADGSVRVTLTR